MIRIWSRFLFAVVLGVLALAGAGVRAAEGQRITVTGPAVGTTLKSGYKATVTWTSEGLLPDAPIGIEIWEAKQFSIGSWMIFDKDDESKARFETVNSGSAEFFVPLVESSSDDYYVVVYSRLDKTVNGRVEFAVEAVDYSIEITAPAPQTGLRTGMPITISWKSTNVPTNAELELLFKQGKSGIGRLWNKARDVAEVAERAPNSGSFQWSVPLSIPTGDNYFFELTYGGGYVVESGRYPVTPGDKSLQVDSPTTDISWLLIGTQKTVEWTAAGFDASTTFDIDLWRVESGFKSKVASLVTNVPGPRTYVSLPDKTEAGLHYLVISVHGQPSLVANSERFHILDAEADGIYRGKGDNLVDPNYSRKEAAAVFGSQSSAASFLLVFNRTMIGLIALFSLY